MKLKRTIIILAILLMAVPAVGWAAANPLMPPLITVASPQNNQVYSQGSVWLNFTALPSALSDFNFTSFSYSLDGQAPKTTDGVTFLTDLQSGSHALTIYGRASYGYYKDNDMTLVTVYFSVNYSTPWVMFTLVFSSFVAVTLLVLFVNRKLLVKGLKAEKRLAFGWVHFSL